jgi:prevent-host-death family protein
MDMVNIHEAKTQLSRLLEEVGAGKEIVIARAGKPIARLVPMRPLRPERAPGFLKGRITIADDFDAPLPQDVLDAFEGRP